MHSERFFETVARTAPRGRCCDRPFNAKTPRVLNGNGCPAEAPYGCFLPDLTRFGTYRHPNPLNARGVQEISYPILGAQVENHFSHSNAATKRASLRREWAIRAPGYSESQRAERARMQVPPPSPCTKPYFASTAAMRSQASINTERGLGTHMRWKNSPPSGSKLRPSCKMTLASS